MEVDLLIIYPIYEGPNTQFRNNQHRKDGIVISAHVYCKLPYIVPLLAECYCCNRARVCVYARTGHSSWCTQNVCAKLPYILLLQHFSFKKKWAIYISKHSSVISGSIATLYR